jgi:hypothetical protein
VSGVTIVATSRNAARSSRYARTASRRRSSSVNGDAAHRSVCKEAILFSQIGYRLAFPAIEPADDGDEQQPEDREVDHERELISRTLQKHSTIPSILSWDITRLDVGSDPGGRPFVIR